MLRGEDAGIRSEPRAHYGSPAVYGDAANQRNPMVFSTTLETYKAYCTESSKSSDDDTATDATVHAGTDGCWCTTSNAAVPIDETQIQAMIASKVAEITVDLHTIDAARTRRSIGWYSSGRVQLQAADQQRKAQKDQVDTMLDRASRATGTASTRTLQTTRDIAEDRAAVNRERIETQEDIAVMKE